MILHDGRRFTVTDSQPIKFIARQLAFLDDTREVRVLSFREVKQVEDGSMR